jgi:hypothetical protein
VYAYVDVFSWFAATNRHGVRQAADRSPNLNIGVCLFILLESKNAFGLLVLIGSFLCSEYKNEVPNKLWNILQNPRFCAAQLDNFVSAVQTKLYLLTCPTRAYIWWITQSANNHPTSRTVNLDAPNLRLRPWWRNFLTSEDSLYLDPQKSLLTDRRCQIVISDMPRLFK